MKQRTRRGNSAGFTLVEIMLVVATIALLASMALPSVFRSRKRAQATRILEDLRMIDSAMQLYAMEFRCGGDEVLGPSDSDKLKKYIKTNSSLYSTLPNDILGNPFTFGALNEHPRVSQATFDNFIGVAAADFWSPYNPES
jgi:prepilin-type N-terminal cleavage/methylation domain-containing protein